MQCLPRDPRQAPERFLAPISSICTTASRGRPDGAKAQGTEARRRVSSADPNRGAPERALDGRRFRILNVIDDVTKECLAAIANTSISGRRVARELDAVVAWRGRPDLIVSDHGTEFTSNAMLAWSQERPITWHFIAPGKPMQNGICEAFNGRMRD
jgi:transposase InsO family protein